MKKICMWLVIGVAATGMAGVASAQELPPGPMPVPTVKVGQQVAAKAANPVPSAAAKNQGQRTSIGVGPASVLASGPSAYWTDMVDLDGDGVEEDTQFLFDKQRGILYTYKLDNYQCANGISQNGNVLMGIYTQGNTAGSPSGSGWFVVSVKAGQCGEKKAGLFGCRFDASGKPTTCGTAKVKEDSGELEVTVKK
ncbi:MAG: hypothetical protein WCA34_04595 [Candidatus Acidiferrales bacterium]